MNYKLKQEDLIKNKEGFFGKVVAINLPVVGQIPVKTKSKKIKNATGLNTCCFLEIENDTTFELRSTFTLDVSICGSALVVLNHMGYDLNDSNSIAQAVKEVDKVFEVYERLIEKSPELFGGEKLKQETENSKNKKLSKRTLTPKKEKNSNMVEGIDKPFSCSICDNKTDDWLSDNKLSNGMIISFGSGYLLIKKTGLFSKEITDFHFCNYCKEAIDDEYGYALNADGKNEWYYDSFYGDNKGVIHNGYKYSKWFWGRITEDISDLDAFKTLIVKGSLKKRKKQLVEDEQEEKYIKDKKRKEKARIRNIKESIKNLLIEKCIKMPASDIDAHLKHKNVDEIKELCEELYHNGDISRTGNYRYFVLIEEKKKPKPKKVIVPKSDKVDVKAELKKFKEMYDEGLIEKEDYDAKKKELLGL